MNPNNSTDRTRLFKAIETSWEILRPFRKERTELVRDYAGSRYPNAAKLENLVNSMLQAAQAYTMALAANMPRILVNPRDKTKTAFAHRFKGAVNRLLTEIRFDESMQQIALDAFFGPGIGKVYLADAPCVQMEDDVWMDPGQPFFSRISLDDFVYDAAATDWRRKIYACDRYRLPYSRLEESYYDKKGVKAVMPSTKRYVGEDQELAKSITSGAEVDPDEVEPMVDLVDVYLAQERKVCVWGVDRDYRLIEGPPLIVLDWDGHEDGPYSMLNLGKVPDNVMPTSPGSNMKALFDLYNSLMRKAAAQARRAKTILTYTGGAESDAKNFKETPDGGSLRVSAPGEMNPVTWGGADQQNVAFMAGIDDMLNRMAGNPGAQLGLDQQADTATQEQMIAQRIDSREANLRFKVNKFAAETAKSLGILLWNDPIKTIPMTQNVAGYEVDASWTPEFREGNAFEYDFDIEPFSMAYKSPQARAAALKAEVQTWMPMYPQLAQMGIQIDLKEYLTQIAELTDLPRLLNVFKFDQPAMQLEQAGAAQNPNKPNGNYTRKNVSTGMSDRGHARQMQQIAAGQQNQGMRMPA